MIKTHRFLVTSALTFFGTVFGPSAVFAQTIADDLICNGCVNATDIATQAVTSRALRSNSVTTSKIPNGAVTFDKLQPEVQTRIDALEEAVQALQSQLAENAPVFVLSGAERIGAVVQIDSWGHNDGFQQAVVLALSPSDYLFWLNLAEPNPGTLSRPRIVGSTVLFSQPNCQGLTYVSSTELTPFGGTQGVVFGSLDADPTHAYYIPTGSVVTAVTWESEYNVRSDTCVTGANGPDDVFQVFPNDSGVTGVESSYPAQSLHLSH